MITPQRQAHMLQVGRTAERLARELFDWPEEKCRQMFLLGLLHDVGYEYADEQLDHPRVGGELLEAAGYRYWQEVRWHGVPGAPCVSDELLVLNAADLLTDAAGNVVSLSDRLGDIEQRYGADSQQLVEMTARADEISVRVAPLLHKSEWLRGLWRQGLQDALFPAKLARASRCLSLALKWYKLCINHKRKDRYGKRCSAQRAGNSHEMGQWPGPSYTASALRLRRHKRWRQARHRGH